MSGKVDLAGVTKLNGANYQRWKFQLELILQANDVWGIVNGTDAKPGTVPASWIKKDVGARAILASTIDSSQ